jgi:hypothetical protein
MSDPPGQGVGGRGTGPISGGDGRGHRPVSGNDGRGTGPISRSVSNPNLLVLDPNVDMVLDEAAARQLAIIQITFAREVAAASERAYGQILHLLKS